MRGSALAKKTRRTGIYLDAGRPRAHSPELPEEEGSPLRGAITGILLGACMWSAAIFGLMRIFKH